MFVGRYLCYLHKLLNSENTIKRSLYSKSLLCRTPRPMRACNITSGKCIRRNGAVYCYVMMTIRTEGYHTYNNMATVEAVWRHNSYFIILQLCELPHAHITHKTINYKFPSMGSEKTGV